MCAPYNGSMCADILGQKVVYYNTSYINPAQEQEIMVQHLLKSIKSATVLESHQCDGPALKIFCHQAYPGCEEVKGESDRNVKVKPLCRSVFLVFIFIGKICYTYRCGVILIKAYMKRY